MRKNFYDKYLEDLVNAVHKSYQDAVKDTYKEFYPILKRKIENIFEETITEFYEDYDPIYYTETYRPQLDGDIAGHRRGSLYYLLRLQISNDGLGLKGDFDESVLKYRDNSGGKEEDLYDLVFRRGYHGGATKGDNHPYPGNPYWRAPNPYYTNWSRPAKKSTPPLENFKKKLKEYEDTDYDVDYMKVWKRHEGDIQKNIKKYM